VGLTIRYYYIEVEVEVTLRLTVSQSVSQSVCLCIEYPCGTCEHTLFPVGMLLSEICGLVSQCNHSIARDAQNPKPYFTVSSETPSTWRARFLYSYPPGTGWPSYTLHHPSSCLLFETQLSSVGLSVPHRKHRTQ
jgi:hypothetical protein